MRRNLKRMGIGLALLVLLVVGVATLFGRNIRALFGATYDSTGASTNMLKSFGQGNVTDYTGKKVHYELRSANPDQ